MSKKVQEIIDAIGGEMPDSEIVRLAETIIAGNKSLNKKDVIAAFKVDLIPAIKWAVNRDWPRVEAWFEGFQERRGERVEKRQERREERKEKRVARKAKRK